MDWLKRKIFGNRTAGNWPKWESAETFRTPNFRFSCSVVDYSGTTNVDTVALLKDRAFLDIYMDLFAKNNFQNILEIGYFQGGMPLFLADIFAPKKILGIDWYPPSEELKKILERKDLSPIKLVGDVDQGDTAKIRALADQEFGSAELDLIVDDCSHYYELTKGCFEALFGYLRPGGKYIIEDWGWTHWPGAPWQTSESHFNGMESMTNLIFELVMAFASDQTKIASIEMPTHSCVIVTRGHDLPHKAPIDLKSMINLADGREAKLIVNHPKKVAS